MFERYTEPARRAIFFARYEASQFGSPEIDTQHLLLGILRQEPELVETYLPQEQLGAIRSKIEAEFPPGATFSTSVNIPLSPKSKLALAWAAEKSETEQSSSITPAHLLAGLLREQDSFVAKLLLEHGLPPEKFTNLLGSRLTWSKTEKPAVPRKNALPLANGLRLFSLLFLFLLAFQIAARMDHLKLLKQDAHFYGIALPAAFVAHLFSLWLTRRYGVFRRSVSMQYLWIATAAFILAIIPVLLSLLGSPAIPR